MSFSFSVSLSHFIFMSASHLINVERVCTWIANVRRLSIGVRFGWQRNDEKIQHTPQCTKIMWVSIARRIHTFCQLFHKIPEIKAHHCIERYFFESRYVDIAKKFLAVFSYFVSFLSFEYKKRSNDLIRIGSKN